MAMGGRRPGSARCEDAVVTQARLTRARSGDERAFGELVEPHRRELHLHCYRILGSLTDAEDALQDTLFSAWRGLSTFAGRSSWRTWLYQVATNRCLNLLRTAGRRPRTTPVPPFPVPEPSRLDQLGWLEPYPDAYLEQLPDTQAGPEHRYQSRETIELAFIAALQRIPPRQAAVLVLRDVLDFSTAEVAGMLDTTDIAVKGALARARAALRARPEVAGGAERPPGTWSDTSSGTSAEQAVARRFAEAFAADDIDGVVALLTDDAWLTMPPAPHAYHGRAAIAAFLHASARARHYRGLTLIPTGANRQPAFACYLTGTDADADTEAEADADTDSARPGGLIVVTVAGDRITELTRFLGPDLFGHFGLPGAPA
jgi:RNA polymerase sigma-70 factor (TIGR02960 family)